MRKTRRWVQFFAMSAVGALALPLPTLSAETWPQRPVRFILPLSAGTGPDITARIFAERLAVRWRQPVLVENRPGADGITGVTSYAGMHDDHVLLFSFAAPLSVYPAIYETLPYDPKRDLVPIASAADTFVGFSVSAVSKVNSMAEFVARARARPGQLNCYPAVGALPYLLAGFIKRQGLSIQSVPYRDQNLALQDLGEGRLDCGISTLALALPGIQSGKIKLVAVTNSKRAPLVPGVPTAIEAGFADLHFEGLVGLFGGRFMPMDRRDRISADVLAVAAEPVVADRLAAIGQIARGSTSADFSAAIEEQRAQMEAIVKLIGAKPAK